MFLSGLPGVTIHQGDGRSYIFRSDDRYNLVWYVAPDSYAASNAASSGAFVLSESYLYTSEMIQETLRHLSDDGLMVVQFGELDYRTAPSRTARYIRTARDALTALGVEVQFGGHDLDRIARASLAIVSPGVPPQAPAVVTARDAGVPVISLESATLHPLQSLTDLLTISECLESAKAPLKKKPKVVLTWAPHVKPLPQCVANSFAQWINAWGKAEVVITHPEEYELDPQFTQGATITHHQEEALANADFVYVKNWSTYNDYGKIYESDPSWMLTNKHLALTNNAKVMHCLPVRRNVELSDEVLRERLHGWTPPPLRYTEGVLAKYARLVTDASQGAITSAFAPTPVFPKP